MGAGKKNWEFGTGHTYTQRAQNGVLSYRRIYGIDLQVGTNHSAFTLGGTRETYLQPIAQHPGIKPEKVFHIGPWALPLGIYRPVRNEAGKKIGEKTWGLFVIRSYPRFTFLNAKEKARKKNDVALKDLKWEPTLQICDRWGLGWANYPREWNALLPYHYFEYVLLPPADRKSYIHTSGDEVEPAELKLIKKSDVPKRKK